MPRRRSRTKCCCIPTGTPSCGDCTPDSLRCCAEFVQVPVEGYFNGTTGQFESGVFNCVRCTLQPIVDERRRIARQFSQAILAFADTPAVISCLIPFGTNPAATNGHLGTGRSYDVATGTALDYEGLIGGLYPEGYKPIGGIFGDEFMVYGGDTGIAYWELGDSTCCAGQPCPGPADDGIFTACLDDLCYCDDPLGFDCDPETYGLHAAYRTYEMRGTFAATGAAMSVRMEGCRLRIEGFVEYVINLGYGQSQRITYPMGAWGQLAIAQPPDCDFVYEDQYNKCPSDAIWYGDLSEWANGVILEPDGPACGPCTPEVAPNGPFTSDCRCERGAQLLTPSYEYQDCPRPRNGNCIQDDPLYGSYLCNACGYKVGGGHFRAWMGG